MTFHWLWLAWAVASPPVASFGWHMLLRSSVAAFLGGWLAASAGGIIVGSIERDVYWGSGSAVSCVICVAAWWWRKRRGRKRAPRAYGAKSRALLAALVRKAREAGKPRPSLRPVPGGVS